MFNKVRDVVLITSLFFITTTKSFGLICSNYGDFKEYNGHYYTTTIKRLTFNDAKTFAQNSGGYLAIPNSQAENDFITSLVRGGQYAWIGVYDPNYTSNYCYEGLTCAYDDSRFKTVKNSSLVYKNWATRQPDNLLKQYDIIDGIDKVSPLGEHWVALASPSGKWADFGNHLDEHNNPIQQYAIFEFDTMPECYSAPSTVTDQIEGRKCNTKIYDNKLEQILVGETFECQQDVYGTEFCPSALALCSSEWDYDSGYSVEKSNTTAQYTDKIVTTTQAVQSDGLDGSWKPLSEFKYLWGTTMTDWMYIYDGQYTRADTFTYMKPNNPMTHFVSAITDTGNNDTYAILSNSKNEVMFLWCDGDYYYAGGMCYVTQHIPNIKDTSKTTIYNRIFYMENNVLHINNNQMNINQSGRVTSNYFNANTSYDFLEIDTSGYIEYGRYNKYNGSIDYSSGKFRFSTQGCEDGSIPVDGLCITSVCPDGYIPSDDSEKKNGECKQYIEYTYYEYLCNNELNPYQKNWEVVDSGGDCDASKDLIDTNGDGIKDSCNSPTPPENNCKRERFSCVANSERQCAFVYNKWQCSPFPCFSGDDITTTDTEVGLNDANNNGWDNSGDCGGQIYIFNGQDNRCRSDDIFFGLAGGGCCDKDKVFLGLVACKEEELKLAKLNQQDRCHYVGEYCSKKIKLIGCIQNKKSYCCFNSKLAKIIQEEGRIQLNEGWGSPDSPQCRGFTPDEFQKLDFSKIDLSDFFGDIQQNFNVNFMQNQQTFIQDRITNNVNNIAGN
jgi:conjugal transfer mating pair stabilization protein TraN